MEKFPDEFDFRAEQEGRLLAELAGLGKPVSITRTRLVGRGPSLQQVPKDSNLVKKLFTEPDPKWQLIEFDSSPTERGRETRVVVHKGATPGLSLPPRQVLTGGRRVGRQAAINAALAFTAGYLEAGRLANRGIGRFLLARMSFLGRWINAKHVESPLGSLVIANGALALAQQFRPNDERIKKLTEAMATEAYQKVYQQIDIEGLVEGLLESPDIKRALRNLGEDGAAPLAGESATEYLARTSGGA